MSQQQQQRSSGSASTTEAPNNIINLDDGDDDDGDDVQYMGTVYQQHPNPVAISVPNPITDLFVSPSTSAQAQAQAQAQTASACSSSIAMEDTTGGANAGTSANTTAGASASTSAPLECPICLQTCIHPARLPCGHIFCFLCVKGVAYKNRRCAMCRREIPAQFLDHPQLVNGIDDICATRATEDGYQWYYEGRNGWWQYDDRTSQDIEEAFKKGDKSCTILVAGYVYIVDLEQLLQQRQNEPQRCRRVKRDLATIPKKGVAGLRIEGNQVTSDTIFSRQQQQTTINNTLAVTNTSSTTAVPILPATSSSVAAAAAASSFISTIAATDAAIRIASDIIGSTLAHADELTRGLTSSNISDDPAATANFNHSGEHQQQQLQLQQQHHQVNNPIRSSVSVSSSSPHSIQDLMFSATEDLLDTTQQVIATNQHTIDLFEQALNDFQALTMRQYVDSSDEDDDDDDDDNEDENIDNDANNGHNGVINGEVGDGDQRQEQHQLQQQHYQQQVQEEEDEENEVEEEMHNIHQQSSSSHHTQNF